MSADFRIPLTIFRSLDNYIQRSASKQAHLTFKLASAMVVCLSASAGVTAKVNAEEKPGDKAKYVGDVFIAYDKTEDKAAKWLTDNGWEPVKGDVNAGKASSFELYRIRTKPETRLAIGGHSTMRTHLQQMRPLHSPAGSWLSPVSAG